MVPNMNVASITQILKIGTVIRLGLDLQAVNITKPISEGLENVLVYRDWQVVSSIVSCSERLVDTF